MEKGLSALFTCTARRLGGNGVEKIVGTDEVAIRENLQEARTVARTLKGKFSDYRKTHIARLEAGNCDARSGVIFMDLLLNFNRVGGHLLNILEAATPDHLR